MSYPHDAAHTMPAGAAAAPPILLDGIPELADELLLATERLAEAVERETECLRRNAFTDLQALKEEKSRLADAYKAQMIGFAARPEAPGGIDPARREALLNAAERLRQAAARNSRAIEAARAVTSQLIQAITRSAVQEQRPQGYGRCPRTVRQPPSTVSLSLNQRL